MSNTQPPAGLSLLYTFRAPAAPRVAQGSSAPGLGHSSPPAGRFKSHERVLSLPRIPLGGKWLLCDYGQHAIRRRAGGQPAGAGASGALGPGVLWTTAAAPATFGLLRTSVWLDSHRLAGQVSGQPGGSGCLRAKPEPTGTAAYSGQSVMSSLCVHHVLLWASLDVTAAGYGAGVLAISGTPLLLPKAHHSAPGSASGATSGNLLLGFLRTSLCRLWEVCAVLPWHLVLHPDGPREALAIGSRFLCALLQPHGATGPRYRTVQPGRHAQPLYHAPAPEAPPSLLPQRPHPARLQSRSGVPASPGRVGPPPAAGSDDSAVHYVFPTFNCELLGTEFLVTGLLRPQPDGKVGVGGILL